MRSMLFAMAGCVSCHNKFDNHKRSGLSLKSLNYFTVATRCLLMKIYPVPWTLDASGLCILNRFSHTGGTMRVSIPVYRHRSVRFF